MPEHINAPQRQASQTSWDFGTRISAELPPWPAPNASMIFSDESSQNKKFFVLGGLYFWLEAKNRKAEIAFLEDRIRAVKAEHKLFDSIKWEKVPSPGKYLEGYKAVIREVAKMKHVRFKCMVVDTHKYPLNHKIICRGDDLTGYLKMYCVFLTDGIMLRQPGYFYDITIDSYQFRPGHDANQLKRSVNGRYLRKWQNPNRSRLHRHCDLVTREEQDSNFLQVVDLLVGAVAFCWNGGMLTKSKSSVGKKELVDVIQRSYIGTKLHKAHHREPFRIWELTNAKDGGLD